MPLSNPHNEEPCPRDMEHYMRRSASLRSHHDRESGAGSSLHDASILHSPNQSTTSQRSLTSPDATPEGLRTSEDDFTAAKYHQPPPASRLRDKWSFSARSISQRFKSADSVPFVSSSDPDRDCDCDHGHNNNDNNNKRFAIDSTFPPISHPSTFAPHHRIGRTTFQMLANTAAPKRPPPDRPATSAAHVPFNRDVAVPFSIPNGVPLPHAASANSAPTVAGHNPNAIYQNIHETSTKRIATMEYMRKVHDGNVFYFNTFHYNTANLAAMPSLAHHKLGRRATNYIVLGYSLPALLDLNSSSALEYLKALLGLLQEFDLYQNLSGFDSTGSSLGRGRVGQMFKSGMGMGLGGRSKGGRRSSTATDASMFSDSSSAKSNVLGLPLPLSGGGIEAMSPMEISSPINPSGHEFTYLLTPYLSFEPDFGITFATLCDALMDTYSRLLELIPTPDVCTTAIGDTFTKADKMIRKILVANVMREFDDTTRAHAKSELAGLGRLVLGGLM